MQIQRSFNSFINPEQSLVDILKKTQPKFITLSQYIPNLCTNNPALKYFLETTLITLIDKNNNQTYITHEEDFDTMLKMNISFLISKKKTNYVQTFGMVVRKGQIFMDTFCEAYTILRKSKFSQLFNYGYQGAFKQLLYKYIILVKQNDNYIQVTGPPIYDYLNYSKSSLILNQKKKKIVANLLCNDKSMTQYQITRRLIFYNSNMNRTPGLWRNNIYFKEGCKPKLDLDNQVKDLVLNTLQSLRITNLLSQSERKQLTQILIFHFQNVRQLCQIKKIKNKKGKITELTNFGFLLKKMCDLPNNYQQLKSQVIDYKNCSPEQIEQIYNKLYASSVKVEDVQKLFKKILNITIPNRLFGINNKNILKQVVSQWIAMNRFEDYKIDDILMRLDITNKQIPWFDLKNDPLIVNPRGRRKKIIGWIICFVFRRLVVVLLNANFYITEKHRQNNRIFYYRKPIWTLVSKLSITKFESNNLKQIIDINLTLQKKFPLELGIDQNLPFGKLRILPKKGTFRPIITFNSKNTISGKKSQYTLNQYLKTVKIILRGLKKILASQFGFSVFDNFQIFQKYEQNIKRWRSKGCPPVCYFSLDIQKCYDSIDPARLRQMIQTSELIKHYYLVYKYIKIYRNKKPIYNNDQLVSCFNAKQRITSQSIDQNLLKIQQPEKQCIYVYSKQCLSINKKQIIQKLTTVCKSLVVVYKNKKYRQTFGIPQGLNISGVLCSLYFALIQSKIKINNGLMMRLTDDYLYLGQQDQAKRVLDEIMQLPQENSFKFNSTKIKSNFQSKYITNMNTKQSMQWIGKTFNIQTLQYFISQQTDKQKLKYAMNVNYYQTSKPQLYSKKQTFVVLRNHLKNKLKSLLINQFNFYFKPQLFSYNNLIQQIRIFVRLSLYKFQPFIQGLKRFNLQNQHKLVYAVYYQGLQAFSKFACSLFPQNSFNTEIYNTIFIQSFSILVQYCKTQRYKVFKPYIQILKLKFKKTYEKLLKDSILFKQEDFSRLFEKQ